MTEELTFAELLGVLIGAAVAVGLVIMLLVYAGGARGAKRYRPGRPFTFTPVWFLAAPERLSRAGLVALRGSGVARSAGAGSGGHGSSGSGGHGSSGSGSGTERALAPARRPSRPQQTGGASDRW